MSVGAVNKQTGDRIPTAGMPAIDDALDLTSVNPVQNDIITAALANKQDKTDNNLQTTDKTIVGAVNELKNGLTNLDVALSVPNGTGKNLLPLTLANLKARNTSGTWVDNVYTLGNVSCTVNTDSTGAVTSLQTTAASTGEKNFVLYVDVPLKKGSYILSSGFNETYRYKDTLLTVSGGTVIARGNSEAPGQSFTLDSAVNATLTFRVKVDEDITAYLMIRPATITDPTFAPYIPSVESRIEAVESNLSSLGASANLSNWNDYPDFNGKYIIIGKLCIFNFSVTKADSSWNLAGIANQQAAIDNTAVAYDAVNQKRIFAKNTTGAIVLQLQTTDIYTNPTNVSGCIVLA